MRRDEWLWGWDATPGIVSVWAETDGRAFVWRRVGLKDALVREEERFRPWVLVDRLDDLAHLGANDSRGITYRELSGVGALRFLVSADDHRTLTNALLLGASRRTGHRVSSIYELGEASVLSLPLEEQYLVASGRTHFRELTFDRLWRAQLDLETTGLDPTRDRVFLIALRDPTGRIEIIESERDDDTSEIALLRALESWLVAHDPDVIENHNLHGFDLPFLVRRAERLRITLTLGRLPGMRRRGAERGAKLGAPDDPMRRARHTIPGRELIDSLDAVRRYDFSTRELHGHGLKSVAKHFGFARSDREYIPGARVWETYRLDPARVRRYAGDDVEEAAAVANVLGGAAFALAKMAPRRYERLADAGAATGVLDPLLVRAYVRADMALPAHRGASPTPHQGAALHLFAVGVAERIVKADVASLYPSLMRQHRIGPSSDRLGAFLALVDQLVEQRLAAKALARSAPIGSAERATNEALSAAMKIVINSAYGYLGAGGLTRFADMNAANEVTRHGRELLSTLCRELAARGVTLLEADTDGVYFAVPATWTEDDERRVVREVGALLPPLVRLELDGRYAKMLSHESKNYVLQKYDGALLLRGVAFRSSRAERYGARFLERAMERLFADDIAGVRTLYIDSVLALRRRTVDTFDVTTRVRLTKTRAQYLETRSERRELGYEAALESMTTEWSAGDSIRVYRAQGGRGKLWTVDGESDGREPAARDYDVDYYVRQLETTFATRFERALTPEDFAAVFAPPEQLSLFSRSLKHAHAILTQLADPLTA